MCQIWESVCFGPNIAIPFILANQEKNCGESLLLLVFSNWNRPFKFRSAQRYTYTIYNLYDSKYEPPTTSFIHKQPVWIVLLLNVYLLVGFRIFALYCWRTSFTSSKSQHKHIQTTEWQAEHRLFRQSTTQTLLLQQSM